MNDHPSKASIPDQQVAPASQDDKGNPFFPAEPQNSPDVRITIGKDHDVCRSANAEGRVLVERFPVHDPATNLPLQLFPEFSAYHAFPSRSWFRVHSISKISNFERQLSP
jgi:hypothetical protein